MKALLAVICLLAGATILPAETKPITPAAPAKPGAKAKVEVKKEAESVIPGQIIPRANGTFLGLEIDGGNFKLSFYDAKKKPMSPDVARAAARWPNSRHADQGPNRTVLNPNGNALVGNKNVQPPFSFTVFISVKVRFPAQCITEIGYMTFSQCVSTIIGNIEITVNLAPVINLPEYSIVKVQDT